MNVQPIILTQSEAQLLSTLLSNLTGRLQYRAMKTSDGSLDNHWQVWSNIEKKVSNAHGFEAYSVPSEEVDAILTGTI
jgi:hypothetical protein